MQAKLYVLAIFATAITTVLGFPESRFSSQQVPNMAPPTTFPLFGLSPNFNDIFERLRQQFAYLTNAVPASGGNTTTITKEINGHKVVVNETVYSNGPGFEFHVRVIDIKPGETDKSLQVKQEALQDDIDYRSFAPDIKTQQKRKIASAEHLNRESVESYSGPVFNYIRDRNKARGFSSVESLEEPGYNSNIETFDEIDRNIETLDEPVHAPEQGDNSIESVDEVNGVVDLSNDIYVNDLAARQNWKPNPDSEVFSPYGYRPRGFAPKAVDLSRDTYINEIAAARGRRVHPDVELLPISRFYYRPAPST